MPSLQFRKTETRKISRERTDRGSAKTRDKTFGFLNPKAICANMIFRHPHDMQAFYRMHNVKRIPT